MNNRQKGILAMTMAAALWSTGGLVIKLLPQEAPVILFYRSFYALLLFGALFRRQILTSFDRQTFALALVHPFLMGSFVVATKLTTAANAIFLQYTGTAYVLLLEPWLFKIPLRRVNLWAMVACFLGMSLFFVGDFDFSSGLGLGLAAFSGIFLAAMFLGQRASRPAAQVAALFWGNVFVVIATFPYMLAAASPTLPEHGMLAFLGIVQIGLGYVLFTYSIKHIQAVESALIAMLEPVLNPVWVFIGYGEVPAPLAIVGGLIIVAALSLRLVALDLEKRRAERKMGIKKGDPA